MKAKSKEACWSSTK